MAVDDAVAPPSRRDGYVSAGGDTRGPVAPWTSCFLRAEPCVCAAAGSRRAGPPRRSWIRGGELQHHADAIREPARPALVVLDLDRHGRRHGSCLAADVAAPAAFILAEDGRDGSDDRGLAGSFVARRSLGRESHVARADGLLGRGMNVAWYVAAPVGSSASRF